MLNIFLRTAKSCFPLQRIFHASNLSVECGGSGVGEASTQGQGWLPSEVCGLSSQAVWVHNHDLCLPAVETWASFLASLCLNFFIVSRTNIHLWVFSWQ